jgi:hypothetical protein
LSLSTTGNSFHGIAIQGFGGPVYIAQAQFDIADSGQNEI